ncbi:MAG: transcriptional repressor [Defluviitaleaceae bacterium]|nr:transcriptional repressor [Defluviitaleaceae bacterium]
MRTRNYSRKREAVLEMIRSCKCHPTAAWVYHGLREQFPDLSLGTVYRNLVLFKQEGTILSVATIDGQERFDGLVDPHGHFICRTCGAISDMDVPAALSRDMAAQRQLQQCRVDRVDCTVYGTCAACLQH